MSGEREQTVQDSKLLAAVVTKSIVFWDITPCNPWKSSEVSEEYVVITHVEE